MTNPEEYKTLRDEVVSLLNRCLVILGAVVTASGVIATRWLEFYRGAKDDPLPALSLSLFYVFLLTVGIVLSYKFYDHVYRIGAYLEVFHEPNAHGWHSRNRQVRLAGRSIASLSEPQVLSFVYWLLSFSATAMVALVSYVPGVPSTALPGVLVLVWLVFWLRLLHFHGDMRYERWKGAWEAYARAESPSSPGPAGSSAVALAALIGLILLAVGTKA